MLSVCKLHMASALTAANSRGVRNPMKISDIGFLKTEPNALHILKIQKPKTRFSRFGFQKPISAVSGWFFTLSHSQFILQQDRINKAQYFYSRHISALLLILSHIG